MAIQIRKDNPSPFRVYWNNPYTGKRMSKSFKDKLEAEKYDALIKFQLQFEKERFLPEEQEPEEGESGTTLQDIFYYYLKEKQFTKKGVSWQLDCMKRALLIIGQVDIKAITTAQLAKVLQAHSQDDVKPSTVCARMHVLYTLIRWAEKRGHIDKVPRLPELPENRHEHFIPPTHDEILRMLKAASPHIQRIIILGSKLGVRVGRSEMFRMRWDDVDFRTWIVRVRAANKNKAEPVREVPVMQSIRPILMTWYEQDMEEGMPFMVHYRGKQIVSTIDEAWHNTLARAGITRRIRPYDLRHAFASDAIQAGADIGTVAKLMGHANVTMTLKYYQHVATAQKKQAVESLPKIDLETLPCAWEYVPEKQNVVMQ